MTKAQIFFKVVLLQVIKRMLPPMGNEIITLVKDTSLARVICQPRHHYRWPKEYTCQRPHLAAVLHGGVLPVCSWVR